MEELSFLTVCQVTVIWILVTLSEQCSLFKDRSLQKDVGVDCSGQHLSHIPSAEDWRREFGKNFNPLNIEIIYLDYNFLTVLRNEDFASFPNLRHLSFENNTINSVANNTFDGLEKLEHLSFFLNDITFLDKDIFKNCCKNLIYLNIGANNFSTIPDDILTNLPSLEYIWMQECTYPEVPKVPSLPSGFAGHPNLKTIVMTSLNMSQMDADFFDNITDRGRLQQLLLGADDIEHVHPNAFDGFSNLTDITLDLNTKLTTETFTVIMCSLNVSRLEYLSCCYCEGLRSIRNDTFVHLKNTPLRELWLSFSSVENLHKDSFLHLTSLEELYLNDNMVTILEPELFVGPSQSLRVLDLCCNERLENSTWATANLTGLITLDMSCNVRLTTLYPNASDGLYSVTEYLHWNTDLRIIENDSFIHMQSLVHLDLSMNFNLNKLSSNCFNGANNIVWLNIDVTNLSELEESVFDNLANLTTLYAGGMNLQSIPNDLFSNNPKISEIAFPRNRLHHINTTFANLTNLHTLYIDYNGIATFDNYSFEGCSNMKTLDISYQRGDDNDTRLMRRIPYTVMNHINETLETLYIVSNNITMFEKNETDYFNNTKSLTTIYAGNNPFECRCYNRSGEDHQFLYFVQMFNHSTKFTPYHTDFFLTYYRCRIPKKFMYFPMYQFNFKSECPDYFDWVLFAMIFSPVMLFLCTVTSVLCRIYRWNIRLWCWNVRRKFQVFEEDPLLFDPDFEFDAMICHGHSYTFLDDEDAERQDYKLIEDKFLRQMSINPSMRPFRFCCDFQHFLPGRDHMEQVHEFMYRSRKVIILWTKNFLSSPLGYSELEAAFGYMKRSRGHKYVIICAMDPVKNITAEMPADLRSELRSNQVIWWTANDKAGQELFWLRLCRKLMMPSHRPQEGDRENISDENITLTSVEVVDY